MRTVKEIDNQIQKEHNYIVQLYAQINSYEQSMEHWLRKNKLYAHRASSFCDRNRSWYDLSFKKQLENLCWEFDKNGKLKKTQW